MKSDHWNFLANLLGTPGPAKSQEEKKKKQSSSDQGENNTSTASPSPESQILSDDLPSSGEALKTPSEDEPDVAAEPVAASKPANEADPSIEPNSEKKITREDVLDALTSTTPPKVLPGFGARDESAEATSLEQLTSSSDSSASPEPETTASQVGSHQTASVLSPQEDSLSREKAQTETIDQPKNIEEDKGDAWGQLAEDIGFTPRESEQPATSLKKSATSKSSVEGVAVDSMTDPVTENQKRKTKQNSPRRSSTKQSAGGFGAGLGFKIEDENEADEPDDLENSRETFGEELSTHESEVGELESNLSASQDGEAKLELPGGWATFSEKSSEPNASENTKESQELESSANQDNSRENEKANQRQSDRRRRYRDDDEDGGVRSKPPRTRGKKNEHQQRESGEHNEGQTDFQQNDRPSNQPDDAHSSDSRKRRTRGRRGARQRMSEEDIQQVEEAVDHDSDESNKEGDSARSRQEDRRRGGRRRNRDRHEATGDEGSRRSQQSDDPELETESDLEFRSEESGHEDSSPSRGRRRGRRGRGGRKRRRDVDNDVITQDSDALQSSIAFDDDLKDDHEMEEIRHGQRSRSRNRHADQDDSDSGGEKRGSRRRRATDSDQSNERPTRSRKDRDTETSREPRGKRTTIPSWIDTIDLLVNANIENHKKTKTNRGRGQKKR